jgi:hypothetical protein
MSSPALAAADTHLQAIEVLRDPSHGRNYSARDWHAMLRRALPSDRPRRTLAHGICRLDRPNAHAAARQGRDRHIQSLISREVAEHFELEANGSYTLDTITICAI